MKKVPSKRSKPASRKRISRQRRSLATVVTRQAIERESDRLAGGVRPPDEFFPPADERERRRREQIAVEGSTLIAVGALVYLREFEPKKYRALISSVMRYVREKIENSNAEFLIRPGVDGRGFEEFLARNDLLNLYEELVARIRSAWKAISAGPSGKIPRASSGKSARYGLPQMLGYARWRRLLEARAEAVRTVVLSLEGPDLDADRVLSWVKAGTTASAVGRRVLGHCFRRTPRQVERILRDARQIRRSQPSAPKSSRE